MTSTTLKYLGAAAACALVATLGVAPASSAQQAARVHTFKNCDAMHKKFPHGVGKRGARDHTSGTPVTNFKRSNAWYRANKGSDADKDGIACEAA